MHMVPDGVLYMVPDACPDACTDPVGWRRGFGLLLVAALSKIRHVYAMCILQGGVSLHVMALPARYVRPTHGVTYREGCPADSLLCPGGRVEPESGATGLRKHPPPESLPESLDFSAYAEWLGTRTLDAG
jgi:hypothetical protein